MRLERDTAPFIFALGSKAKSGKSECAKAIHNKFHKSNDGPFDVMRVSFAGPLRTEVEVAVELMNGEGMTVEDKVKDLCLLCGVEYDAHAPITPEYPYTKQRALLQWWGTEYRRSEDPFYWVRALEQAVIERKPQIVLIDDLRYPNEFFWVHHLGGTVVKVDRPDYKSDVPQHISELALDGYEFDHTITSKEGRVDQLREDAIELFDTVVNRWSGAECASVIQTFSEAFATQ